MTLDPATLRALADRLEHLQASLDASNWGYAGLIDETIAALLACADAQEQPAAPAAPDAMREAELDAIETRQRTEAVAFLRARHTPVATLSDDTLRALADKYSDGWLADYECGKYQPLTDLLVTFAREVLVRQQEGK